jgi:hypothetical protein
MPHPSIPALLTLAALTLSAGSAWAQRQPAQQPSDTGQNPAAGSLLPPHSPGAAAGPGPDAARQPTPETQRERGPSGLTSPPPAQHRGPNPANPQTPRLSPPPTAEPRQHNDFSPPRSPIEERPGERNRQPSGATTGR